MTKSVFGMWTAEVLESGSGLGDYNLEVSRNAYCDAEVVQQPLNVVFDLCTGKDLVLLCQEALQDFEEVAAGGIEDLKDKHTSSDTQLQESRREAAAIERFPLGVQSNDHAALWWSTSDFFKKSRRHLHVTCHHRLEDPPLE